MTTQSRPVIVALGTDPGARLDATATRRLAGALLDAAHTSGAHFVNAAPGAVGAAFDTAAAEGSSVVAGGTDLVTQVGALAGSERVAVVLLAGDVGTARTLLDARVRGWSVIVVPATGGLAAQLAADERHPSQAVVHGDELTQLRERRVVAIDGIERLGHTVVWELDDADVVKQILARRKSYDDTARVLQRRAHRVEIGVLSLGVVAVFLAVLNDQLDTSGTVHDVFRWALIVVPAIVAALIALDGVIASGKRWLLIRAACEAMKREILVWRTGTGVYAPAAVAAHPDEPADATELLADRAAAIEAELLGSIVAATIPFARVDESFVGATDDDDGLSRLDAPAYLRLRVADQLAYYRRKIARLHPQRRAYQVIGISAGAAGSILAAAGQAIWMPIAFAIGAAIGAYAKQRQLDTTLLGFSRAAAALEEIRTRWDAAPVDRHIETRFEKLVRDVEDALEAEQSNWAKQMKVALDTPLPRYEDLSSATEASTKPPSIDVELPSFDSPTTSTVASPAPAQPPAPAAAPESA